MDGLLEDGVAEPGLIHGAKAVQYFIWVPELHRLAPEAWGAVCAMASECTKLSPALLSAEPQPRVTSSVGSVHAAAWKDRGRITILAANTLDKPQAVRLRLEGIGYTGKAIVLFKKREVEVKNGAIEETIGAFGTRAYVVPVGK